MNRILMIALEFPPCHSSGVQRTYKFAEYLCQLGWEPIILTAERNIYQNVDDKFQVADLLKDKIYRVKCVNLKKTFSIKGKYPSVVDFFDKYWPWYFTAVPKGLEIINYFKPDIIWSTYPAITAHLIAYQLSKKTCIPWVMDYRDPLRQHYDNEYKNADFLTFYLERKMLERCSSAIFTTNKSLELYSKNYPSLVNKFQKISNGYSEIVKFSHNLMKDDKFVFIHSGVLYGEERDISPLITAVHRLTVDGSDFDNFIFRFRGAELTKRNKQLIQDLNVEIYFEFLPVVDFASSVEEMAASDAYVLIQSEKFLNQVPGKIYEYCQFRKPILAMCSNNSATYEEFYNLENMYFSNSVEDIEKNLKYILSNKHIYSYDVSEFSRLKKAHELFEIIESLKCKSDLS